MKLLFVWNPLRPSSNLQESVGSAVISAVLNLGARYCVPLTCLDRAFPDENYSVQVERLKPSSWRIIIFLPGAQTVGNEATSTGTISYVMQYDEYQC